MVTLHQIAHRARNRMENGRFEIREKRPANVTWQQYEYWPCATFVLKDGRLFFNYRCWAGRAVPNINDVHVEITKRMIDEDDFTGLRYIRDGWVLKGLDLEEEWK